MNSKTEAAMRATLLADGEITAEAIEHAIELMKGQPSNRSELCKIVSFDEAMRILGVKRCTLKWYVRQGYLTRVLGAGNRSIGINGNSLDAFRTLRIDQRDVRRKQSSDNH